MRACHLALDAWLDFLVVNGLPEIGIVAGAGAGVGQRFSPWKTFWEKRRKSFSSR